MKSIFTCLCIACLLLTTLFSGAQSPNRSISGLVKDIQNEPAPNATVRLLKAADSSLVQNKIARANGRFEFTNLPTGEYLLSITAAGMKPYTSAPLSLSDKRTQILLPAIILVPAKKGNLQEVTVTAKKPLLEQDIDKTIVNVEAMLSASTSNTLEVLEKTPGITVDANGEISLNGATGVNVLIDGRPTFMSGRDLAAYLRSLPGGLLDKIELMTNPPAKYDANGGAIINIRLKKKRTEGYAGSASLNYNQGVIARSYNSLNLNYLNRKLNLFGNFSYSRYGDFMDEVQNRSVHTGAAQKSTAMSLHNYYSSGSNDFNGRLGMDYALTPKTTIGFIGSGSIRRRKEPMDYANETYSNIQSPDSIGWGHTDNRSTWRQLTANANLQHKFNDAGRELTADVNYINYNNKGVQELVNNTALNAGDPPQQQAFVYRLPSNMDIYTARADYAHPLAKKASLSGGFKTSWVENDNQSDYFAKVGHAEVPDYGRSNHFIYREHINALYVNGRKDWKRGGLQLGLRVENTQTRGTQLGNAQVPASTFTNDYTGLFPSVFFTYKLDSLGRHNLSLNYSRRVNRPGYQQLNPFLFYIDQYSFSTGNPYLQPAYGNRIETNYRYKQLINAIFMFERQTDGIYGATRITDNVIITQSQNLTTRQMAALLLNIHTPVTKWWTVNYHIAGARFTTTGTVFTEQLDLEQYTWRTNMMSQFKFRKDWSAEIFAAYNAPNINWQRVVKARYWVNAAIQKKVLKGKGSLKLNVDDIFYTLRFEEDIKGLKDAVWHRTTWQDSRRVGLSFSYSFGKEIFARKRKYNDNTADDVKERAQ